MSNFDKLFEAESEKFQNGGFLVGQRVRFKPNALKHEFVKNRAQSFRDLIASCMEPSFDLNLRIGAIKSIYPTTTQNYGNGTQQAAGIFFDIYIEYAPGLFRNPMTIPLEVISPIEEEGRGPVPDSLRRKNKIHKPQPIEAEQEDSDHDLNLTAVDTKMPGANKWDDTQPGGGNFKVKVKK